jgi:predicted ATPase/DNA-binding winged helix-turn-helix (wHTH) protein
VRVVTGSFTVDLDRVEIRGAAGLVPVEPQVFDVIELLLRHRDRVVTREELLDRVWGSRFVSESVLTSRIKSARRALGDDGSAQSVIRTVRSRGYRWVAPVELLEDRVGSEPTTAVSAKRPAPRDPILGRERELAEVAELLGWARMVTVLGPGGVGKTRLAAELVHRCGAGSMPVLLVELAPVHESEATTEAVAAALGVQLGQRADLAAACVEYLADRRLLLVVDNCEHVVEAVAPLLERLVGSCAGLTVLATSRRPLGLPDEHVVELQPLAVPDEDRPDEVARSPAVELFVTRARRADRSFRPDGSAMARVGSLCRALDGLPLAIELAAGRSAALGLDDVLARLDRRLDLLSSDRPTVEARHRSLRATLAWSYELLDADSKLLFRSLSVFPGGFDLATAERVAAAVGIGSDPATVVARLVQTSMLVRTPTPSGLRFNQLETVRAFGLGELGALDELDRAHELLVDCALAVSTAADAGVHTPDEPIWDDRIRREIPNLRAARRHLVDHGRYRELADLLRGLDRWAHARDVAEIWTWQAQLLAAVDPADPELRPAALAVAVMSSWLRGRLDLTSSYVEELLAGAPSGWQLAQALTTAANLSLFARRPDDALRHWLRRREIPECPELVAESTALAALAAGYLGDFPQARRLAAEARALADAEGSPSTLACAAYATGEIEHCAGSGEEQRWLQRAIELADTSGTTAHFYRAVAGVTLASSRAAAGDVAGAARLYRELIDRWLRTGTWTQQWTTLRNVAELLAGVDDGTVVRILAAAHADPVAAALDPEALARERRLRADAVGRLGAAVVEELEAAARSTDRAVLADQVAAVLNRLGHDGR